MLLFCLFTAINKNRISWRSKSVHVWYVRTQRVCTNLCLIHCFCFFLLMLPSTVFCCILSPHRSFFCLQYPNVSMYESAEDLYNFLTLICVYERLHTDAHRTNEYGSQPEAPHLVSPIQAAHIYSHPEACLVTKLQTHKYSEPLHSTPSFIQDFFASPADK